MARRRHVCRIAAVGEPPAAVRGLCKHLPVDAFRALFPQRDRHDALCRPRLAPQKRPCLFLVIQQIIPSYSHSGFRRIRTILRRFSHRIFIRSIKTNPPFAVLCSVMCSVSFKCSKTSLRKPYWRTYGRNFSQRLSCTSFSTANSSVAIPGTFFLLCANARATSGTAANRRLV